MRKGIIIVVMALLLSLCITAVAFAHPHGYTYFDNGNSGWVGNGHNGHYWSGDFDGKVVIDGVDFDWNRHWDRYHRWDDGEWYYYYDDNGNIHYYYNRDDDGWKYHSYVDKYGNTQYSRTKVERISK